MRTSAQLRRNKDSTLKILPEYVQFFIQLTILLLQKRLLIEFETEESLQALLEYNLKSKPGLWINMPCIAPTPKMVLSNQSSTTFNSENEIPLPMHPALLTENVELQLNNECNSVSTHLAYC